MTTFPERHEPPRVGDVFRFRYNREQSEKLGFSATHCFEGTLHARQNGDRLILVDTYWGISGDGRMFTLEEAERKGTLTFYCNLNDVERIDRHDQVYYADDDLFTVSEQHACVPRCVHWFKRKGAVRNAEKMLRVISERIEKNKHDIDSANGNLDRLAQLERQIRQGDLGVYL
jgi:hypothetical protein